MSARTIVRGVVRPVVGDRVWAAMARMDRRLRSGIGPHARAAVTAGDRSEPADDLVSLATRFKTDKWGVHYYARHYERHLGHLRSRAFNLLEIGVGGYARLDRGGASLRMWKHYFPLARVFGMDIYDKSAIDESRIKTFIGDQSDPESLRAVAAEIGELEVIIDDGSHLNPHVRTTFETLFPLLADGGLYAIEDLQTSYWPEWEGSEDRANARTSMTMLKTLTDGLNYEEFVDEDYEPTYFDRHIVAMHFYHNLAIIEKGHNCEGTNKYRVLADRYRED